MPELQAALDAWVVEYNTARPHEFCGSRPPAERFRPAQASLAADTTAAASQPPGPDDMGVDPDVIAGSARPRRTATT